MLKAYAVALVLTTATPLASQAVESAQAPEAVKAPVTNTQLWRPATVRF